MKKLIGIITIVLIQATAIATSISDGMPPISDRVIVMKQQISDFNQQIQNKSASGLGRYYVGADGACDFNTIQAGINATIGDAFAPEVLIASNKTYAENLVIQNINMFMDGSYSSCADARSGIHGGNGAQILGASGSGSPIILILGSSFNYQISLRNFRLLNSSSIGIRTLSSSSSISLDNISFIQLTNGAISVEGNTSFHTTVLIKNSDFIFNSSNEGGAIKCSGTNNLISLENTILSTNSSTGDGGAVFLDQACDFSMIGSGFANNTTDGRGGAIYAEFGSDIVLEGVQFNSNAAQDVGGAIYAQDGATTVSAIATKFQRNKSDLSGGAISLFNGASFTIKRTGDVTCLDSQRCNFFDANEALLLGGAIHNSGGNIDISSTYFEDNRADFGTAIYSVGASSSTKIEGSIFNHNGNGGADGFSDIYVVRALDADITVTYTTFADNDIESSTFGVSVNSKLDLFSSIVSDSGNVVNIETGSVFNKDCILVTSELGFDNDGDFVILGNPIFVDSDNRDYHINAVSSPFVDPAVDACNNGQGAAIHKDIDFEDRGFDDVLTPNNNVTNGVYDIGADEAYPDLLFADGFE